MCHRSSWSDAGWFKLYLQDCNHTFSRSMKNLVCALNVPVIPRNHPVEKVRNWNFQITWYPAPVPTLLNEFLRRGFMWWVPHKKQHPLYHFSNVSTSKAVLFLPAFAYLLDFENLTHGLLYNKTLFLSVVICEKYATLKKARSLLWPCSSKAFMLASKKFKQLKNVHVLKSK